MGPGSPKETIMKKTWPVFLAGVLTGHRFLTAVSIPFNDADISRMI